MRLVGKQIRTYRIVCPYCSAIIEFNDSDVKKSFISFIKIIQCPGCKEKAYIDNMEKYLFHTEIENYI